MPLRIRGQEETIQFIVDGDLQTGSFTKVVSFKDSPNQDLTDSDFVGETESDPDIQHHGWNLSFTTHETDTRCRQLVDKIVAQLTAGAPLPNIAILRITRYRDPSIATQTLIYERVFLKQDDHPIDGRKEYVKNSFTGKCRTRRSLGASQGS